MTQKSKASRRTVKRLGTLAVFRRLPVLVWIGVFGIVGLVLLRSSQAATYTAGNQAETAALAGKAATKSDPNASNSAAVIFGAAKPAAPDSLTLFIGGNSIAGRFNPGKVSPGRTIKQYEIFRDGQFLKSVQAGVRKNFPDLYGAGFIDENVLAGTTRRYQVRQVDDFGLVSDLTTAVSVTQAASSGVPVPNITLDTSAAPDTAAIMNSLYIPYFKTWYPKVATYMAIPYYVPNTNFTFKVIKSNERYIDVSLDGKTVTFPDVVLKDPNYHPGASTLEMSFLIHRAGPNTKAPGWLLNGMATWPMMILEGHLGKLYMDAGLQYNGSPYASGLFIEYIRQRHPAIMGQINKMIMDGTYTDAMIQTATGKTVAQWAAEWQKRAPTAPKQIKFNDYTNKCLQHTVNVGPTINDCVFTGVQLWQTYQQADATVSLKSTTPNPAHTCLGSSSQFNKTPVGIDKCSGSTLDQWIQTTDGSLKHTLHGTCLETPGGNTANGTKLVLAACDGSAKQKFTPVL